MPFRPDPKRMPRKIRYARPVVCQGAPRGNWPPPRGLPPFIKPLRARIRLPYRLRVSSGGTSLSGPGSARIHTRTLPRKAGKGSRYQQRTLSRGPLVHSGSSGSRFHAVDALGHAQSQQALANLPQACERAEDRWRTPVPDIFAIPTLRVPADPRDALCHLRIG